MVKNRLGRSVSKIEIRIYQKELTKEDDGGINVCISVTSMVIQSFENKDRKLLSSCFAVRALLTSIVSFIVK